MYDSKKILAKTINNFKISPKSDHSLSTGKFMNNEITSFEISTPCLVHVSEYVSHFCQNCLYKPLCGICLQEGNHKNHSVKNVDKASKNVQRSLTQILITARAKSNLFEILNEHNEQRQIEIKNQLKDFLQTINEKFDELERLLKDKRKRVLNQVQEFYRYQKQLIQETTNKTRQQNQRLKTMIEILSEKVEKLDGGYLCIFYYEKKQTLQDLVEQGNLSYEELRNKLPQLKWILSSASLKKIQMSIEKINVERNFSKIEICMKEQAQKQKSQKKQFSFRKLEPTEKVLVDNFHTTGFWTPKHLSSKKLTKKLAKDLVDSKKLLTLISNDSPQKVGGKNLDSSTILQKKTKNKPKY